MIVLHVPLDTFGAKLSFVEWKLFPRFKAYDFIVSYLELNAALLTQ
ncbi:MAG: hypothetical protein R2688_06645 [Fimbriimonadaceae bacterium]